MQCNQPFYGNSFPNAPFGSPFNTPLQSSQGPSYPEIVGEGHVTSVTLPDGSVQLFFIPTLKWWSPNASQCQPFQTIPNPMFANANYGIPQLYNNTTWFIRSISNPFPQNAFSPSNQLIEPPRLAFNGDYNRNLNYDVGYQVKFHNDVWTSTTDLVYFYPALRQRDFVFMPPCKDKTVQIDTAVQPVTNNTVCHYQLVCSKPCNCLVGARPMSLETLVVPNLAPQSDQPCNYPTGAKPISFESSADPNLTPKRIKTCNCVCSKPICLAPSVDKNLTSKSIKTCNCPDPFPVYRNLNTKSDKPYRSADANKATESPVVPNWTVKSKHQCSCPADAKPMSVESPTDPNTIKPNNYSADTNKPMSLESLVVTSDSGPIPKSNQNTSTDDSSYKKEQTKRGKITKKSKIICGCHPEEKKKKPHKAKNIICECESTANIVSFDKSITTYTDESVGINPVDGRETQTKRTEDITSQCDVDTKPVQNKPPLKTKWIDKGCNSDCCSTCDERSGDDTNVKKYTQRNRGGKYKRSKPNKCDCGCCDCDSSVDCGSDTEVETVPSKDKGRETPFTCSTCSNTTFVLANTRGSPIKIGKKASIGKANSSLQWLKSDITSQKSEINEKEMSESPVSTAIVMEEKNPEKQLDPTCECDVAASTSGDGNV